MKKNLGVAWWLLVLLVSRVAHATTWSAQDYDLYSGDFNGDGVPDLLYIAKAPGNLSGIALGVSGGFDPSFQSWPSNFLGISWSGNQYNIIILQNTSGSNTQADILLQSKSGGGASYLLQPNSQGRIVGISQSLGSVGGLAWSADQQHIVAGDFNHDGLMDVFLQATSEAGTNAVILAASNGQMSNTLAQTWGDEFLGFKWSASEAVIYAGDFNGDGYCDLLIQARPRWVIIDYGVPFPVPTYPNPNGIAFSHSSGSLFSASAAPGEPLGSYPWSRNAFGVDWSPLVTNLLVGNFNGTSYSDVLLQALHSSHSSYLVTANGSTSVFAGGTALASNVNWSADTVHIVAGNYGGGSRTGVYFQALSPSGTNSFTTNVTGSSVATTVHDPSAPPPTPPGTLPAAAGRTPGTFAVSPSGAADYSIPIWAPPGVGAVQLSLALNYDSRSPDWNLGVGWSIAGMSAISRCNRTWAQDGYATGVTLGTADRLCLDGAQLKVVSGSAAAPAQGGTTYATEIEGFATIAAAGSSGSAPVSFTVTTKNGLIYDYGLTSDSKILTAGGAVRAWALSQIRDRVGNKITVSYYNDSYPTYASSSYRVKEVDYPYTASGQGPFYSVVFSYGPRPIGTNTPTGYLAGSLVQEPNQLNSISVKDYGATSPIKSYNLTYDTSAVTSRLRLRQVQECSANSCLLPTQIGYQAGSQGWSGVVTTSVATSGNQSSSDQAFLGDFNGDGLTDVLYDQLDTTRSWHVSFASAAGYQSPIAVGLPTVPLTVLIGHFSGNGQSEILEVPAGGTWSIYAYNGSSFVNTSNGSSPVGSWLATADWDGDGLDDLVVFSGTTISVMRNTTVSGGAVTFANAQVVYTVPSGLTLLQSYRFPKYVADFNADGRADVAIGAVDSSNNSAVVVLISNGFGSAATATEMSFGTPISSPIALGDLNGDGCTDIFSVTQIFVSQCDATFVSIETGLTNSNSAPITHVMSADWDGDGLADLLYLPYGQSQWYVLRSTGTAVDSAVATGVTEAGSVTNATQMQAQMILVEAGDQNGDALQDLLFMNSSGGSAITYELGYAAHAGAGTPADLATSFTDGFAMTQSPTYVSITQSNYTKCSGAAADCPLASFPEQDTSGPLYVVNQFTASDGTGSTYQDQFWYYGARFQAQGRGFEGFYTRRMNDSRNVDTNSARLYQYDYFNQAFPYTGTPLQRLTSTSGAVSLQSPSAIVDDWTAAGNMVNQTYLGSGQPSSETRVFPYVGASTETRYEFGALSNGLITTAAQQFTYGDGYGNLTNLQTTITDNDSTSPFYNSKWQTTVATQYLNDTSAPCMGLPTQETVTSSAQGQAAQTRTTYYTPDTNHALCRESSASIEPGTPALNVLEGMQYDSCGNVSEIDVTGHNSDGSAMAVRSTKYNYSYSTQRCQLPEYITNALGQSTAIGYLYDFGVPSQVTDPNGVPISWQHDDFGRASQETRPDGTSSVYSYESCVNAPCWGFADLRLLAIEADYDANGNNFFNTDVFYDGRERLRYHESNRVLGTWTVNDARTYDSLGRLIFASNPYSFSSNGQWSYAYDLLSRLTTAQLLTSGGTVDRTYLTSYAGRSRTVTDPLHNIEKFVTDVAGYPRRVTDPTPGNGSVPGATTAYDFDDFGNLSQVTDAIGAVWQGFYNLRGFRYQVVDPDSGTWNFVGDSLNEAVGWTDAKSQQFGMTYDLLGRILTRTEPEGMSTWTWGHTPANHDIGSLDAISGYGYVENLNYDAIGRLQTRQIVTDATYQYDYAYNALGAIDTITYPTSPAPTGTTAARFTIKYGYSYGQPYQISDVTQAVPTTLWTLSGANDYSSPTNESLGNAVSVSAGYTAWTDDLTSIQSGVAGAANNRQNLAYQWDTNGNLNQRQDLNQSLTEVFGYDALNRLTSSSLNGTTNFSASYTNGSGVDQAGNIWSRSDVGSYTYGDAHHPHGATAAGSHSFTYDNNGNVVTRDGLSLTWASYNLPTSLQATIGGTTYSSQFLYGPEHQRYQQTASYSNGTEVTSYVGGLLEKVTGSALGSVTAYRHYIQTPSGLSIVLARNSDGTTTTTYALSDHLGSSDALVDGTAGHVGNLLVQESFAPFGQRRSSNWSSGGPSSSDWTAIAKATRHGFTFHEMLDNIGLIHMNGRVYDPNVGRFLSVDPLIGDFGDSQSVNPYAYVGNRPLSHLDPTGWGDLEEVVVTGDRTVTAPDSIPVVTLTGQLPNTIHLPPPAPSVSNDGSVETIEEIREKCWAGCSGVYPGQPPDPGQQTSSGPGVRLVAEALIPSADGMPTVIVGVYLNEDGGVTVVRLSDAVAEQSLLSRVTFNYIVHPTFGWIDCAFVRCSGAEAAFKFAGAPLMVAPVGRLTGAAFRALGGLLPSVAEKLAPPAFRIAQNASSRALGRALVVSGVARGANMAAHHIVAGGAAAAAPARAVLQRFGIGINEAANGVFLPRAANGTAAAVHAGGHSRAYYEAVNAALAQATTRDEVLEALEALRQDLQNGKLGL